MIIKELKHLIQNLNLLKNIYHQVDYQIQDVLLVATFNTERTKIDSALLRKGRLVTDYKFENLSTKKSNKLLKKIGVKEKVDKPMSLADIYYYNDNNINKKDKPTIGFITNKK